MARRRGLAIATSSRVRSGLLSRLLVGALLLVVVGLIVLAAAAGFFTFRIVSEHNDTENVSPASFLLTNFQNQNFGSCAGCEGPPRSSCARGMTRTAPNCSPWALCFRKTTSMFTCSIFEAPSPGNPCRI
jgi:hypothetical protein